MRPFVVLAALWVPPMLVGCVDPAEAPMVEREPSIELQRVGLDDLVDGEIALELTDGVLFSVDAGVDLTQVWVVGPDGVAQRLSAVVGAEVSDEATALGTGAAVDAWLASAASMRLPGAGAGCWWVYEGGTWVRYCIA